MRCVHRGFDLLEAHIVAQRLRHDGIGAWVFDENIVRQDWFKTLAFGGYRVMVENTAVIDAAAILAEYRAGQLALPSDEEERPICPVCGGRNCHDNPVPRRWFFLSIIAVQCIQALAWIFFMRKGMPTKAFGTVFFVWLLTFAPVFLLPLMKWRFRCDTCNHRWRELPRLSYAELAKLADAAGARPVQPSP